MHAMHAPVNTNTRTAGPCILAVTSEIPAFSPVSFHCSLPSARVLEVEVDVPRLRLG